MTTYTKIINSWNIWQALRILAFDRYRCSVATLNIALHVCNEIYTDMYTVALKIIAKAEK